MKNLKRILCVALILALAASCFTGCKGKASELDLEDEVFTSSEWETVGGEGGSNKTSTITQGGNGGDGNSPWQGAEAAPDRNIENPLSVDLKGKTITVYGVGAEKPDASKSKTDQALEKMYTNIEKKMNCKIKFVSATFEQVKEKTLLNTMSNTYFADIVRVQQYGVLNMVTSNNVYNLKDVSTVSLAEGYMNAGDGVNAFHLGSGYWAVNDPVSLSNAGHVIFFNKRIMKEVTKDADHPYKLMKQGKWNISALRDLNKKATKELNGDGKITDADQLGMIQIDIGTAGYSALLQACGAQMLVNNKGLIKYNMEDKNVLSAINLGTDLFYKDNTCLGMNDSPAQKAFMSGHALFLSGSMGNATVVSDMKDDFGIVPFPHGDNKKDYSVATNWNCQTMLLPASLDKERVKVAGAFLQAYNYSVQDVIKDKYEEWGIRYLRDEKSVDNLWIGYTSQVTTMANAASAGTAIQEGTYRACYSAATKSPATTIQENKNAAIKAIEDINKKLK